MKKLIFLISILIPLFGFSQNDLKTEYDNALTLLENNKVDSAYFAFKSLEQKISKSDTLYDYVLWSYTMITTHLEEFNRLQEKFDKSLEYGLETFNIIQKAKERFDDEFAKREFFMIKNIIVSYYGLGNFKEGKKWKKKMYTAKKDNELPEGIDEYFNYDYFTFDNKNIWGYEWYAEIPKDRFLSSFTKVVYYVYSTNSDGTDKDQLYRLHVLMFHGNNKDFDYVLDKRLDTATEEVSGTLYSYTYKENIDFEDLKNDVKEVIKGNLQPDTKRTMSKKKDENGKINVDVELKNDNKH